MKIMAWTAYGPPDVLQLQEIEKPVPKANEVLIKVHATTVTAGDCEARAFKFQIPFLFWLPLRIFLGLRKPRLKTLGQELAGEIEAVGSSVTRFKVGDEVFAATLFAFGSYAEYICLPETHPIALKPPNVSYAEAATIPTGGVNGLHFVRNAQVQAGERVLINGAGGSIGTYALQIAKSRGAEVTCVDSGGKLAMLRAIGADHVLDYTREDFTQGGETYDVIIDVVGKSPFAASVRALKSKGRYVLGNPSISGMIRGLWSALTSDKKVLFDLATYKHEDLIFLSELLAAGTVKVVIDRRYALEQVAEAHRYVESGQKTGNLIITVGEIVGQKA